MDRRNFIKTAGTLAGASIINPKIYSKSFLALTEKAKKKPNILYIMTDQQSYNMMSLYLFLIQWIYYTYPVPYCLGSYYSNNIQADCIILLYLPLRAHNLLMFLLQVLLHHTFLR